MKKTKYLFHFIMTMEIVKNTSWYRKAYVCKGKVTTDSQVARVIRTIEHSHDANLERVEATKIIASIKESAGTRRATPAQLYADHTQYATAHIRAEIGHQDAVKRTIRRETAKHLPISPVSLSDLEVTGEWTTTGGVDKEDFLIHDEVILRNAGRTCIPSRGWCTCWSSKTQGGHSRRPWTPSRLFWCNLHLWNISFSSASTRTYLMESPSTFTLGSQQRQDSNPLGNTWATTSEASAKSHQTTTG